MGDWMTVNIHGTINPEDVPAARAFVDVGDNWDRFHPLCTTIYGGVCGLGQWIPASGGPFTAVGNLAERNFMVADVAEAAGRLAEVAPSLSLKIYCGGPYESLDCVATVLAGGGMPVMITDPEVPRLDPITNDQMEAGLMYSLFLAEERRRGMV